jgi:AAA15 family ATPase/GTPase
MISKILIQRFKKFENSTIELAPFTVLMGENSSGKTTVLQAINLSLELLFRHKLIEPNNGDFKIRKRGVGLSELPSMSTSDIKEIFYAKKTQAGRQGRSDRASGGSEICLVDSEDSNYKIRIQYLFGGLNIKCISAKSEIQNNSSLHLKQPLFISGFVGLRPIEERLFPAGLQDRLSSGHVSSVIRNLLVDCKENYESQYNKLKKRLLKDFGFRLDKVSFDVAEDMFVTAHYEELCDSNKISLDLNASGSGFMQILQILAPIYRFCPKYSQIVLLDEPDAHLHPNLQTLLANTLRDIQKELSIQIIISTHSTSIIRAASPTEVVPVSAQSSNSLPLSSTDEVEEEISARIDSYELGKSVISGKIVFLEDGKTSILEAFDKALNTGCFFGANTVPVLKGRGKDDKVPYQLHELLEKFVPQKNIEIHVIRDGDSLNQEWRAKMSKFADEHNVILHHLERHEIENYLLCPKLIYRALVQKHGDRVAEKEVEESTLRRKIADFLRETIEKSRYRMDSNLEDSIWKTAILVNDREYVRSKNEVASAAIKIRQEYEDLTKLEDLILVGMGKEARKQLFKWLGEEKKLNLSEKDIIDNLTETDIPQEIHEILQSLRSNAATPHSKEQLSILE